MKPCRECGHEVSGQALACPNCGAPQPAREKWDGWGFEYKSEATLFGWPLLPHLLQIQAQPQAGSGQGGPGHRTVRGGDHQYLSIRDGFIQRKPIHRYRLCPGPVRGRLLADRPIRSAHHDNKVLSFWKST